MLQIWKVCLVLVATLKCGAIGLQVIKGDSTNALCENISHHCCTWNHDSNQGMADNIPPVVVFAGACSGSSAVLDMAFEIANASNHSVLDCDGGYELLADIDAGFYGSEHTNLSKTFRAFYDRAATMNRRLLFKAEARFARKDESLMKSLIGMNAKIVSLERWNKLDVALCAAEDCYEFTDLPFGHIVDEDGKKGDCAFRGRGYSETVPKNKVHVNVDNIRPNLHQLMDMKNENQHFLNRTNSSFQRLFYEDLFAYESGTDDDLLSSSIAWQGFMVHLGLKAKKSVLYKYLKDARKVFSPSQSHQVANWPAVRAKLKDCDAGCKKMVRMIH